MSNTFTKLRYHVLFETRDGRSLMTPELRPRLCDYVAGIVARRGARLPGARSGRDYVHLLLDLRPDQALAQTLSSIKSVTSKWLKRWVPAFAWQRGYKAFSVSESRMAALREYLCEERRHRATSFSSELRRAYELHGVETPDDASRHPTQALLRCHVVFSTKNRLWLIAPEIAGDLYRIISEAAADDGAKLLEVGGMPDHVHLLLDMRPEQTVARAVKAAKGRASRWMNQHHPPFGWQRGYGAFTVSESLVPTVRDYIRKQPEHHETMSFAEEYRRLLYRHGATTCDDPSSPKGDGRGSRAPDARHGDYGTPWD